MTGQPTENNGKTGEKAWDDRTKALVACLEALLELHRAQDRTAPASDADPDVPPSQGKPRRRR